MATPHGVAQFLRIIPPNLSIMTEAEQKAEIEKFEAVLDTVSIPFQIFITDKIEDLSENKEFYSCLRGDYEVIVDVLLQSMEDIESDNSAVQRAYYIVVITKDREEFQLFKNVVASQFHTYQVQREELATLLRNYILREFIGFDLHSMEAQILQDETTRKKKKLFRKNDTNNTEKLLNNAITKRLTPQGMSFGIHHTIQNDFLRKTILIKNFPKKIDIPCFFSQLAQIKNTTMSMRLEQMNDMQGVRLIDNQMNTISAKGHGFRASQQIEADVESESVRTFYRNLIRKNSKLYYINIYIEVYASTEEELRKRVEMVKSKLSAYRITTESLTYEQNEGFSGVYPLAKDLLPNSANNMPSPTIAGMFPFSHSSRNDTGGMLLGSTADGGHMSLDLWQRTSDVTNGNFSITGDSGQGKSWLLKKIISQMILRGVNCFNIDPEGEFNDVVSGMGGTVINCADGAIKINPFEVRRMFDKDIENEKSEIEAFQHEAVFFQHLSWLKDFFRVAFPDISSKELSALMILTQDMYSQYGITEHTDISKLTVQQYPTFSSVYEFIANITANPNNTDYSMISNDMFNTLLLLLQDAYRGSLGYLLNGHTNISNDRIINFDIQRLLNGAQERLQAVLFNNMTYSWNRISNRQGYTMFTVDELHKLMTRKTIIVAGYLKDYMKRARKYDAIIGTATQSLGDFLDPELMHITAPLLNTPAFKFMFYPGDLDKSRVQKLLGLSDGEIEKIATPKQGRCLLKAGLQKYLLHVGKLPYEEELFGNKGGR